MPIKRIQKWVLHPLTALLFASAMSFFVKTFGILDFSFAPHFVFIGFFASYLLFSRKYDLSLSVVFFCLSLWGSHKAWQIYSHPDISAEWRLKWLASGLSARVMTKELGLHPLQDGDTFRVPLTKDALQNPNQEHDVIFYKAQHCQNENCPLELKEIIKNENQSVKDSASFWYIADQNHVLTVALESGQTYVVVNQKLVPVDDSL